MTNVVCDSTSANASPPRVSVVLPLFNTEQFVEEAVRSILGQTFDDFEFLVVDDGSTDTGPDRVARFADPRLRLFRQPENHGIADALNFGVAHARGRLIARMDADDISLPSRLAQQVAYLEDHPEVGVVGCPPTVMSVDGAPLRVYPLLSRDRELRRFLTLQGPFCHGSVMFRPEIFRAVGGYRSADEPAEDFALWVRIAQKCKLANLPQTLYCLRTGDHSVSARNRARQLEKRSEIRNEARRVLGEHRISRSQLREGIAYYRSLDTPLAGLLVERFASQHQELVSLDAARRSWRPALRNAVPAMLLGPANLSTAKRMFNFYRAERRGLRRGWD